MFVRLAKWVYAPVLRLALRLRYIVVPLAVAAFGGAVLLFGTLGQEFVPTLDEQDLAIQRCARMTERSGRRACMAATTSLNDSAAAEKNAFATSYNGLRNGLGLIPVSAVF